MSVKSGPLVERATARGLLSPRAATMASTDERLSQLEYSVLHLYRFLGSALNANWADMPGSAGILRVTSMEPTSLDGLVDLRIRGSGFTPLMVVSVNGIDHETLVLSATELRVRLPRQAVEDPRNLRVRNCNGHESNELMLELSG